MSSDHPIDELSGVSTTGHEWDGIKELNNPMPRWWLWTLLATIVWSSGYVFLYPALPGVSASSKGMWAWSSRGDLQAEMESAAKGRADRDRQIAGLSINAIWANETARSYATAAGASLFKVYCVQCHGAGAQGGPGFPNLNDDSWLWGGKPEQILQTISNGIRDPSNSETHDSLMPSFGKDGILTSPQISAVAHYVRQLAELENGLAANAEGSKIFTDNCAACHGEKGDGKQEFGAPQLNDAIWLRGSELATIAAQVTQPRHGMMPAWRARLGEGRVKELATYVLSLGGGQ